MKRVLVALLVALLVAPAASTLAQSGGGNEVVAVKVEGTVTRGTAMHVQAALEEAEERNAPLLVQLDTPGGLVSATLDINKALARAEVPVLTYVGPRGAIAESAGTFMMLMGHPNGMAPNTQIGSAEPVAGGPGGGNVSDKTVNFLVGQIRGIAERTDRNQTVAEQFITENLNLNESRAQQLGMADHVEPSRRAFLDAVHGEQAKVGEGEVTLDTEDARIVEVERGATADLIDLVSNPQIAFLLFLVGIYGVIFGLAAPGTFVPETIGALALVLALIGLGLFDTSTSGIVLILLASLFFVSEVFTPTHGVLTVAGVVAMILGALFLLDEPLLGAEFLSTFRTVAIVAAIASGGVVLFAVWIAFRTRDQPASQDMVGEEGTTASTLDPDGRVRAHGELWNATADRPPIPEGEPVRVIERDGLHLTVTRIGDPTGDAGVEGGSGGEDAADTGDSGEATEASDGAATGEDA